jgi:hypothetical protein
MAGDAYAPLRHARELRLRHPTVSRGAAELYLLMATFANPDGSSIRPTNELLARLAGKTERTVERAIAELLLLQPAELIRTNGPAHKGSAACYSMPLSPTVASGFETRKARQQRRESPTVVSPKPDSSVGPPTNTNPSPSARADARAGWDLGVNPGMQVQPDCSVILRNPRPNGWKAYPAARLDGECDEGCDYNVTEGEPIFHDPESGRVKHQTCRFDPGSWFLTDAGNGGPAGVAAKQLGPCAGCGDMIERGDPVVSVRDHNRPDDRDRFIHARESCCDRAYEARS